MSHTFKADTGLITDPALRQLFARLQNALNEGQPEYTFQVRHATPAKTVAGMFVNADGSDWNPGAGAGLYLRNEGNSQWDAQGQTIPCDPGTITVPTGCGRVFVSRLTISGTNRVTLQGTARIAII